MPTSEAAQVLDASAVLAFLLNEPGGDVVEDALQQTASCSAANWSEVCQKITANDRNWRAARALLLGYGLVVEPVTAADAELAASFWPTQRHLSLGDRLCLALGERLDATVWTADAAWGTAGRVRQLR